MRTVATTPASIWAASTMAFPPLLLQPVAIATTMLRREGPPGLPAARRKTLGTPAVDGDLRFHEATFIASHNAHAALAVAEGFLEPLGSNQEDAIIDQLTNDGVRALLIDIMLNEGESEPLRMVHSSSLTTLDFGGLRTGLGSNLIPFLEENADAIVSFFLENQGDVGSDEAEIRSTMLGYLRAIFSSLTVKGISLKDMTFKYDDERWEGYEEWPTLDEIRHSGQRIFVFSDRSEFSDTEYGFMFKEQVLQENDWQGIDDCEGRYMWGSPKVSLPSNNYWTRLFIMNHFCCGSGPDSKSNTMGENLIGGGNNGWGKLYTRIQKCISNNGGFKPNFIALDWVTQSKEALEIRDYLNFGGRLGTGQSCGQDSDCATSSCNVVLGVCQCQACSAESADVCPGCESGQYCAWPPGGEEINTCQYKDGATQQESWSSSPNSSMTSGPTFSLIRGESNAPNQSPLTNGTDAPTQSPAENILEDAFYCGVDYFSTLSNCNEATKCPRGNDDCPPGEICFAGINDCTPPPTLMPSDKPSGIPSFSTSPSGLYRGDYSTINTGGTGDATTSMNANFCGTDLYETQANCQNALPCPGSDGNNTCAILGSGYACFSNIVCDGVTTAEGNKPQASGPSPNWLVNLGLTKAPAAPTRPPSLKPTKAPFDFNNQYFCGANYTDAEQNCFKLAIPCPTGEPSVCGGGTCFSGINCTAPPSDSPTSFPTGIPTESPTNSSLTTEGYSYRTTAPFDEQLYYNQNGAMPVVKVMLGKYLLSMMIVFEFVELVM